MPDTQNRQLRNFSHLATAEPINFAKIQAAISPRMAVHMKEGKRRAIHKHILLQKPLAHSEYAFVAIQSVACVKKADTWSSP